MLRFASLIINKGVGFYDIAMVFIALIPTFLEIALPMSTLLGVMLAFARLSGDSEIIVMRASGVSIYQLISPIIAFGIIVGALALLTSLYARPWGYEQLSRSLFEIASNRSTAGLDEGVFSKLGELTIYAENINHETGDLQRVLIDDRRVPEQRKVVIAKRGIIVSNPTDRTVMFRLADGVIHEILEGKYSVTDFTTNTILVDPADLFSDDAAKKGKQFSSMTFSELREVRSAYTELLSRLRGGESPKFDEINLPFSHHLDEDQVNIPEMIRRISRADIESGRRFSMPFAAFMLSLVGMALGIQPPRTQKTWGVGISAVFGLAVFVLYYGLLSIGMAMGESGELGTLVILWLPNLLISILAAVFLYKLGSENWHSVTQALDAMIRSFKARIRRIRT